MTKFVALLRGINVGGHNKVPMIELKTALERHGFKNVKTLLASGNVVFNAPSKETKNISKILESTFGFKIDINIIQHEKIKSIVGFDPFKKIKITPKINFYVTFLKDTPKESLKIPELPADKQFQILKIRDNIVFSVVDLEHSRTVDLMAFLDKTFGKGITTRKYNTIIKIAEL